MLMFAEEASVSTRSYLLNIVVFFLSLLLMLVVLIQRGKGGGLAGAFGGVGGSSPFGSRAGDAFTKFTLWLAGIWALVILISVVITGVDAREVKERPSIGAQQ